MMPVHGNPQREARSLIALSLILVAGWALLLTILFWVITAFPAHADVLVPAAPDSTPAVALPWGDLLIQGLSAVALMVVTVLSFVIRRAILQVAPWAAMFLTQQRTETMVKNVTDYALNAVAGAVKGKAVTIPVGSAIIATAVQRAIDAAPAQVIDAVGGLPGLAERVFRSLNLENGATAKSVLEPLMDDIRAAETLRAKG